MKSPKLRPFVQAAFAAAAALLFVGSNAYSRALTAEPASRAVEPAAALDTTDGPIELMAATSRVLDPRVSRAEASAERALGVLASAVSHLSHPRALHDAFASYFAFRDTHPEKVRKPYLYFVWTTGSRPPPRVATSST